MMNIGLDFGTTYTKICQSTHHISIPPLEIPTVLAMTMKKVWIGLDAQNSLLPYELLPGESFWGKHPLCLLRHTGYNLYIDDWTTEQRWLRFLELALDQADKHYKRHPERVGLAVPSWWRRKKFNPHSKTEREKLLSIISSDLGFIVTGIYEEPVCASAFYITKTVPLEPALRLAVCDLGGGTVDFSLCELTPKSIKRLFTVSSANQERYLGGLAFDEICVNDYFSNETDLYTRATVSAMLEFEHTRKVSDCTIFYEMGKDNSIISVTSPLFNGSEVQLKSAIKAFHETRDGIIHLLERFLNSCRVNNWKPDKIMITGGFSLVLPIRQLVENIFKTSFGLDDADFVPLTDDERKFAISYGVAFLASGQCGLSIEPSRHEIGLITTRITRGRVERYEVPLVRIDEEISAGQVKRDRPLIITVTKDSLSTPFLYSKSESGVVTEVAPQNLEELEPGSYDVSICIDFMRQPELIFTSSSRRYNWPLPIDLNEAPLDD